MPLNLSDYVVAAGALGTASFALVDGSKAVWGGVSNAGFGQIKRTVTRLFPTGSAREQKHPMSLTDVLGVLRANWLNGTALGDQKLIAKTLIKLRLNAENARHLADVTGVDPVLLASVAAKIANGESLSQAETDVYGRFDLILTTLLDEGYQRADQIYRNKAKVCSIGVSVVLGYVGGWAVAGGTLAAYWWSADSGVAVLTGLIATPLAPISKDLATGLTAAMKAIGTLRS
jgi:hypothetical protein